MQTLLPQDPHPRCHSTATHANTRRGETQLVFPIQLVPPSSSLQLPKKESTLPWQSQTTLDRQKAFFAQPLLPNGTQFSLLHLTTGSKLSEARSASSLQPDSLRAWQRICKGIAHTRSLTPLSQEDCDSGVGKATQSMSQEGYKPANHPYPEVWLHSYDPPPAGTESSFDQRERSLSTRSLHS